MLLCKKKEGERGREVREGLRAARRAANMKRCEQSEQEGQGLRAARRAHLLECREYRKKKGVYIICLPTARISALCPRIAHIYMYSWSKAPRTVEHNRLCATSCHAYVAP